MASLRWSAEHRGARIEAVLGDEDSGGLLGLSARPDGAGDGDPRQVLDVLLEACRWASSRDELARVGHDEGLRIEDVVRAEVSAPRGADASDLRAWLGRRLARGVEVLAATGAWELRLTFARRGQAPRPRYELAGGKVRVEAFELHAVEHCNLRCEHCCNLSPYVAEKVLSAAEIEQLCRRMAQHLTADVFKIMGGEPLLHPDIVEVLRAIRRTAISPVVRLFTNGLLLHRMGDDFWGALDELTISTYVTAPVKPAALALAREKARAFDVVLNVKEVARFSEVLRARREEDEAAVQSTYDACWLRHRCLVVRGGRFYMCTRAAYAADFHQTILHGSHPQDRDQSAGDGLSLDTPDFGRALADYMNRGAPLASCRFCYGSAGPTGPHRQLSKEDVRAGRLHVLARSS